MSESFIKTEKIAIDHLMVEITRKCQLKCAHCLKGDAQNIDMSHEIIDKLLESVSSIGRLLFTGGEPTMNLEGMRYFLKVLKEKDISLNKLVIITNGCNTTDNFINLIKEYHDYMTYNKEYGKHMIVLRVSNDVYHMQCCDSSEIAYNIYDRAFSDYPNIYVSQYNYGNIPKAIGRGENLNEAYTGTNSYMPLKKIEVMSKGSHNYCVFRKYYKLQDGTDAVIMCPIIISVHGNVSHGETMESEYKQFDKVGASIESGGLIEAINQYNQSAEYCIKCMLIERYIIQSKQEEEIMLSRLLELLDGNFYEFVKNVKNVSMKKFYDSFNDEADRLWTEDEFAIIVEELNSFVGEDVTLSIIEKAKTILNMQLQKSMKYRQKAKEIMKIATGITSSVVHKPSDTAYYGDGKFKNDEEKKVSEDHPTWEHKDCIKYANSYKWVKYFLKRNSISDNILLTKHLAILESIQKKYGVWS